MLAVRLTVEAVNGSLAEAGVDDRCAQLSARFRLFFELCFVLFS
jgi:hypothetical protein